MHCKMIGTALIAIGLALFVWRIAAMSCFHPPVYRATEALFKKANRVVLDGEVWVYVHERCACRDRNANMFRAFVETNSGVRGAYFFETEPTPFVQPPTDIDLPYVAKFYNGRLEKVYTLAELV